MGKIKSENNAYIFLQICKFLEIFLKMRLFVRYSIFPAFFCDTIGFEDFIQKMNEKVKISVVNQKISKIPFVHLCLKMTSAEI